MTDAYRLVYVPPLLSHRRTAWCRLSPLSSSYLLFFHKHQLNTLHIYFLLPITYTAKLSESVRQTTGKKILLNESLSLKNAWNSYILVLVERVKRTIFFAAMKLLTWFFLCEQGAFLTFFCQLCSEKRVGPLHIIIYSGILLDPEDFVGFKETTSCYDPF